SPASMACCVREGALGTRAKAVLPTCAATLRVAVTASFDGDPHAHDGRAGVLVRRAVNRKPKCILAAEIRFWTIDHAGAPPRSDRAMLWVDRNRELVHERRSRPKRDETRGASRRRRFPLRPGDESEPRRSC